MKFDLMKIASAWITKMNPTDDQKVLAEKRLEICSGCEYISGKPTNKLVRCLSCGCPLHGKVFSQKYSDCPQNKWSEVDKPYFKFKENKTLI